ncbi:hypothetical protein [Streptomyces sp. NPDC090026]|uniref:hypothetical protein n=1 Tax=Streptomyces sp. NPDC090026 TaxID=3365923 RepID=UPI00380858EF
MSDNFDQNDIRAMRRQGDLRSFLRQQMRPIRQPDHNTPPPRPKSTSHIPGAWPARTRTRGTTCNCPTCLNYAKGSPLHHLDKSHPRTGS